MVVKNADTHLPLDQAELLADAAVSTVLTPVEQRDFDHCMRLNEPVEKRRKR